MFWSIYSKCIIFTSKYRCGVVKKAFHEKYITIKITCKSQLSLIYNSVCHVCHMNSPFHVYLALDVLNTSYLQISKSTDLKKKRILLSFDCKILVKIIIILNIFLTNMPWLIYICSLQENIFIYSIIQVFSRNILLTSDLMPSILAIVLMKICLELYLIL